MSLMKPDGNVVPIWKRRLEETFWCLLFYLIDTRLIITCKTDIFVENGGKDIYTQRVVGQKRKKWTIYAGERERERERKKERKKMTAWPKNREVWGQLTLAGMENSVWVHACQKHFCSLGSLVLQFLWEKKGKDLTTFRKQNLTFYFTAFEKGMK